MLLLSSVENFILLFAFQTGPTPEELAELERIETEKRVRCDFYNLKPFGACV